MSNTKNERKKSAHIQPFCDDIADIGSIVQTKPMMLVKCCENSGASNSLPNGT